MINQNRVLTFEQGCEYLGYKKSYVYKLTSAGIIPHSKPNGSKIFFDRQKLEDWMLSNSVDGSIKNQSNAATSVTTRDLNITVKRGQRED